jgi:hypothetical protein
MAQKRKRFDECRIDELPLSRTLWRVMQFILANCSPSRHILNGQRAEFWLNLQKIYELRMVEFKSGWDIKERPRLHDHRRLVHSALHRP